MKTRREGKGMNPNKNIPISLYSTIKEKSFHVNIQEGTELLRQLSCAIIAYVIYTAGTHQEPINGYGVLGTRATSNWA